MSYFVVPYTWVDTDDYAIPGAAIVAADTHLAAIEAVRSCVEGGDRDFWARAADFGDSPEHAGDGCYYVCTSCDCGDEGCAPDEHGNGGHESLTVMVNVHADRTRAYPTRFEAEDAIRYRMSKFVFIDAADGEDDAQVSA